MFSVMRQGVFRNASRRIILFRSIAAGFLALRCCSCRKGLNALLSLKPHGFSFLLHEQKKRNKENSPSALFCLLRYFSTLNKKNSLRSNSFLFLTLRKVPPLYAQKVRPDILDATLLRSLLWMFFPKIKGNKHANERSNVIFS